MKKKQYQLSKTRKALIAKEREGVPYVIWSLSPEQREEVEKRWDTEEYLYAIRTRQFQGVRNLSATILKDLHYANKRGKSKIVRKLKEAEKRVLEENHIKFWPIKIKIYLAREKASA